MQLNFLTKRQIKYLAISGLPMYLWMIAAGIYYGRSVIPWLFGDRGSLSDISNYIGLSLCCIILALALLFRRNVLLITLAIACYPLLYPALLFVDERFHLIEYGLLVPIAYAAFIDLEKDTSKNLLRSQSAAKGSARNLAYLADMSRLLRAGRLASWLLITIFRGAHKKEKPGRLTPLDTALFFSLVVGLFDEILQYFVPGRVFDTRDIIINWVSAILGYLLISGFQEGANRLPKRGVGALLFIVFCLYPLYNRRSGIDQIKQSIPVRQLSQPNVLLLTIDSLRADHLGCYGYPRPTSPNIDRLASAGSTFTFAHGQSAWTSPGLLSILTGFYPSVHGVEDRQTNIPASLPTLPRIFSKKGYHLPNLVYLTTIPGYANLGYETLGDLADRLQHDEKSNIVATWLDKERKEPFFLWYHYRFIHLPYDPPFEDYLFAKPVTRESKGVSDVRSKVLIPENQQVFDDSDRRRIIDLYDGEIHRADRFIGEIVDNLKELGLLSRTIVVITSDHGEELFDHGSLGHASTNFAAKLTEEILHIPLIILAPGYKAGTKIATPVEQIDIAPTILALCGFDEKSYLFQGRSLVELLLGNDPGVAKALFAETSLAGYQHKHDDRENWLWAITSAKRKLIEQRHGQRTVFTLYDLEKDPDERNPVILEDPADEQLFLQLANIKSTNHELRRLFLDRFIVLEGKHFADPIPAPVIIGDPKTLASQFARGTIDLAWQGRSDIEYLIEYSIGHGIMHSEGVFPVKGNRQRFGPFPASLWLELHGFNPWKFRIVVKNTTISSPWYNFEIDR